VLPFINDHLPADHRHHHAHLAQALDRHPAEVLGEDDEISRLTHLEAPLQPFLKRRKGPVNGVHPDGRGQVDALVGATDVPGHSLPCQRLLDAKQRRIVRHRGIGTPYYWHPGGDETLDREHRVGAGAAVVVNLAVAEPPKECQLHGRYDLLFAHPVAEIGRADGAVLDAVAQPLTRKFALSAGHSI
jgi:hypothetical protein